MRLILFFLPFLLLSQKSFALHRLPYFKAYSVDIRDLVQYRTSHYHKDLKVIITSIQNERPRYFPNDIVYFQEQGISKFHKKNQIYGMYINQTPYFSEKKLPVFPISFFIHTEKKGYFFQKFLIEVNQNEVSRIKSTQLVPTEKTKFHLKVDLVDRKAILTDKIYGFQMTYPIGVGGFDPGIQTRVPEGLSTLKTPLFKEAQLKKFDHNYEDHPFLPIFTRKGKRQTPFGFHTRLNPSLHRGFVSHGCMRMRRKDLYELKAIVYHQKRHFIPLDIFYNVAKTPSHPYPQMNFNYAHVINCGNKKNKAACTDKDGLTQMKRRHRRAPISTIFGYTPQGSHATRNQANPKKNS